MPIGTQHFTVDSTPLMPSPAEAFTRTSAAVESVILCDWSKRHTLMKEFLGYMNGSILYPPHKYNPEDGGQTLYGLYAHEVNIERVIKVEDGARNDLAKLTVRYKTPDANMPDYGQPTGTTWVTESIGTSSLYLSLNRKNLYLGTHTTTMEDEGMEAPAKLIKTVDWVYTKHWLESIPSDYYDIQGKCNSNLVYSIGLGRYFKPETLLAGDLQCQREITSYGAQALSATFTFHIQNNGTYDDPKGWNHFPDTDIAAGGEIEFVRLYNDAEHTKIFYPYQKVNFDSVIC